MIPRQERSIRNIPVPSNHRRASRAPTEMEEDEEVTPAPTRERRPRRSGRRMWLIVATLIVVGIASVLALLLSTLFAGATVTVFPRKEAVTPPASIVARLEAPVGSLTYETMTISRSATTTVPASGSKQVSRQASGLITIYNTYNAEPQRLIANTRFEAPDGKIYRIHESVVVPGMKGTSPGTASITVYADSPGAEYNRGTTRFTIPGFKSDPRYSKFYAEANAITNGFVGTEPAVAPADLAAARTSLERSLQSAIQSAIMDEVPEGYIALPTTIRVSYGTIVQSPSGSANATLSQSGQAVAAIVRANDLASVIAESAIATYEGEAILFEDVSGISVTATTTPNTTDGSLTLTLSGSPTLIWQYDQSALASALLGKDKDSFQEIIESFEPAIMRAEASIRPFWKGSFPNDPEKIKIEVGAES